MALNVYRPPNPAAGAEVNVAVPGQYTYDLYQLAATLTTVNQRPLFAIDVSGNGHNGSYNRISPANASYPDWPNPLVSGLLTGDDAVLFGTVAHGFYGDVLWGNFNLNLGAPFTIEAWIQATVGDVGARPVTSLNAFDNSVRCRFEIGNPAPGRLAFQVDGATTYVQRSNAATYPNDGARHYVAVTYDGVTTFTLYIDGAAPGQGNTGVLPAPPADLGDAIVGGISGAPFSTLTIDEPAYYTTALTGATIAAHYAAGLIDWPTYVAAVAADTPDTWYHLDDVNPPDPATPTLFVTDGTHTVGAFPSDVTFIGPGVQTYRWIAGINNLTPVGLSTDVLAQLSRYTLPSGYVMRTVTAGIQANAQWSDVQLWVDQRPNLGTGGLGDFQYRNVLLLG